MSEKSRILVVDDNEEFCQNVTDILRLKDYEVAIAYVGLIGYPMEVVGWRQSLTY